MYPEPQETRNIATARNGRVRMVYEFFAEERQPDRFQIWKGRRCLLEIFDASHRVPHALPRLIDKALATERLQRDAVASLSGIEKLVCFVLGRGALWAGDPQNLPELAHAVKTALVAGSRRVEWRLVRLKGWSGPKLLLLVRTVGGGRSPMGTHSTTTIHNFAMSPREAETLRDGLIALRDHPVIGNTPPELSRS